MGKTREVTKTIEKCEMTAYKLLTVRKDGSLGSLFINRRARLPVGKWMEAESHPTKGYALRPKWHATEFPVAPHLSMKGRQWFEVEIKDIEEFQRPQSQGGKWYLAKYLKIKNKECGV